MAGACTGRGGSVPASQTQRQICKAKSAHGMGNPREPPTRDAHRAPLCWEEVGHTSFGRQGPLSNRT